MAPALPELHASLWRSRMGVCQAGCRHLWAASAGRSLWPRRQLRLACAPPLWELPPMHGRAHACALASPHGACGWAHAPAATWYVAGPSCGPGPARLPLLRRRAAEREPGLRRPLRTLRRLGGWSSQQRQPARPPAQHQAGVVCVAGCWHTGCQCWVYTEATAPPAGAAQRKKKGAGMVGAAVTLRLAVPAAAAAAGL